MRITAVPHHHRLLAVGALISAVTLGTVTAASASGDHHTPNPPKGGPPIGYQPTDDAPDDLDAADDAFAACMRDHDQDNVPALHPTKDATGGIRFTVEIRERDGKAPDVTSRAFQKAFAACKGPLEEAGVSFPEPRCVPGAAEAPG
ncbi:hypothetical protein ACIRF8_26350 [Streptomyces sp. NPDC102406]|uniref:hypothetical protein n=1 Tax=Streptomyces sp. NPDC102406 TaxID=3366171 RepID=UPI00382915CF